MHRAAPAGMPSSWADLPRELLLDVSGRLRNPYDFVRLHAVCAPWRGAAELYSPATPRPTFQPWLLMPCYGIIVHSAINLGRAATSDLRRRDCDDMVLAEPAAGASSAASHRTWVASTDGTAAWLFTWSAQPRLVNLLTGDITLMPQLPENLDEKIKRHWEDPHGDPRGIVYDDGTVFLYSCVRQLHKLTLMAAIIRPCDATWQIVRQKLDVPRTRFFDLVYHDSKMFMCARDKLKPWRPSAIQERDYVCGGSYFLKSGAGELICAFVIHEQGWQVSDDPPPGALLVEVEALEGVNEDGKPMWVKREGRSLSDRVLFLGSPASFSVDAMELDMVGGCAYFMFGTCVFGYNLIDGEIKLVDRLPHGRGAEGVHLWLRPQPTIGPIQEVGEKLDALDKRG